MRYCLFNKVKITNNHSRYNNTTGEIVMIHPNIDSEPVYTIKYDKPFGSCTKGMFKESEMILIESK